MILIPDRYARIYRSPYLSLCCAYIRLANVINFQILMQYSLPLIRVKLHTRLITPSNIVYN